MSKISEFANKQDAHNEKIDKAITGIQGDVEAQAKLIAELQASGEEISAEDQARLDAIDARNSAVSDKLEALDALTPPVVPNV